MGRGRLSTAHSQRPRKPVQHFTKADVHDYVPQVTAFTSLEDGTVLTFSSDQAGWNIQKAVQKGSGESAGARTQDQRLKRAMLYQLSYALSSLKLAHQAV
jgi:hypothetical protein